MSSGIASGGKSKSKSSQKTTIPDFLKPFVNQIVGTGSGALGKAGDAFSGDNVADLNADQLAALDSARGVAGGEGAFLPTAQQAFLDTAKGGPTNFLPQSVIDQLTGGGGSAGDNLGDISPDARAALESSAKGDFLFGGQGFNEAVDASVRAAKPHILSTFGKAGVGGATGGLSQAAIGQSAVDAFARQFANERGNQIGAANSLAGQDLSRRGQDIGVNSTDLSRDLQAAGLFGDFANTGEARRLNAASQLPGLGLLDSQILGGVGDTLQGQAQAEIDKPGQNQLQLLQAALSGIPGLSSLFGQKGKSQTTSLGLQGFGGPNFGG